MEDDNGFEPIGGKAVDNPIPKEEVKEPINDLTVQANVNKDQS
jgi:hypothetical protein